MASFSLVPGELILLNVRYWHLADNARRESWSPLVTGYATGWSPDGWSSRRCATFARGATIRPNLHREEFASGYSMRLM